MIRLFAPAGAANYSYGGIEMPVGADGSVEVSDQVAVALREHGFTDAPPPPSEGVMVKRADLLVALEKLGVAANPGMDAGKLAAALGEAVAVKEMPKAAAPASKPTLSLNKGAAA
jgi:hypothetical protein